MSKRLPLSWKQSKRLYEVKDAANNLSSKIALKLQEVFLSLGKFFLCPVQNIFSIWNSDNAVEVIYFSQLKIESKAIYLKGENDELKEKILKKNLNFSHFLSAFLPKRFAIMPYTLKFVNVLNLVRRNLRDCVN